MKLVSWNCNGAFRKKFEHIVNYEADICIIQECENPVETKDQKYREWSQNYLWIGNNKNKGLGVFAKSTLVLEKLDWSNVYQDHKVNYFLPCRVNDQINLLAVWAHGNNSPNFGYIGQVWKYFQINGTSFEQMVIAGDFNSNAIWDQWDRWWNHTDVVKLFGQKNIQSVYHYVNNEDHGKETQPTFFLQRKLEKPYHIDYIFAETNFLNRLSKFQIGNKDRWLLVSDHLPVFFELDI